MEWFKFDSSLPDHEKVRKLMDLTGWEKHKVLGVLCHFWARVAQLREDGDLTGLDDRMIRSYAGISPRSTLGTSGVHRGYTGGEPLLDLFCSAELIDRLPDGRIVVHGWYERYEPMMRDRLASKARMSKLRHERKACSAEQKNCSPVASKQASKQASIEQNPPSAGGGYSEDFELFWNTYPKARGPKHPAWLEWKKVIAKGIDFSDIIAGANKYADFQNAPNPNGSFRPATAHARTWLHQHRWADVPESQPEPKTQEDLLASAAAKDVLKAMGLSQG